MNAIQAYAYARPWPENGVFLVATTYKPYFDRNGYMDDGESDGFGPESGRSRPSASACRAPAISSRRWKANSLPTSRHLRRFPKPAPGFRPWPKTRASG